MTRRVCSVANCNRPHSAHGYCQRHANQYYRHGRALKDSELKQNFIRLCSVKGCGEKHSAHGYCNRHAKQWKRHGRIISDKELRLSSSIYAGMPRNSETRVVQRKLVHEVTQARKRGERVKDIAERLGITEQTITKWTAHLGLRAKPREYITGASKFIGSYQPKPLSEDEYWKRLAEIPPDTRTPGQKLLGEPVYERSALYEWRQRQRHD